MMFELLDADEKFPACPGIMPFGVPALTDASRPASVPAPAGLTG
jgi:hypothetical protein